MLHETSFIATIVVGLVLAFVFGANRVIMGEREIARAMIEEVRADSATGNAAGPTVPPGA
jgi:hypothetical protein